MDFQFVIDEGHCLPKDHFSAGFRNFCSEISAICKDHFSKNPITIVPTVITNEVAADLEQQFNLSDALAVLDKAAQLQRSNLQFSICKRNVAKGVESNLA